MPASALWWQARRSGLATHGCCFAAAFLFSCSDSCFGGSGLDVLVTHDPVSMAPLAGARVSIVGGTVSGVTGTAGHVVFPTPGSGHVLVRAGLIGYCTRQVDVTLLSDGRTYVTIPLCGQPDHVQIGGNTSGEDAVVLLDALVESGTSTHCRNDLLLLDPSSAPVAGNAVPPGTGSPPCSSTAAIFTSTNGAELLAPAGGLGWTAAVGDEVGATLPATKTPLPLRFWISLSPGSTVNAGDLIRNIHLKTLADLLLKHRTGIEANWKLSDGTEGIKTVLDAAGGNATAATALRAIIGKSCQNARAITLDSRIYEPEALNVYYVDGVVDPEGTNRYGWYCYEQGVGNILFVEAESQDAPHMLAHELGHALGLLEPWDGHAYEAIGYTVPESQNVMGYGPGDHDVFTLGQVFRMSFSKYSWLNAKRPTSGTSARDAWLTGLGLPLTTPVACPCEPRNPSPLDCPRSLFDLTREPPTTTVVPLAACKTDGLPGSASLSCGEVMTVTVTFRDEAGNADAGARTYWDSDNTRVATVVLQDDPLTTLQKAVAEIHAWHAGTARITVYGGGPSASQTMALKVPAASGCTP